MKKYYKKQSSTNSPFRVGHFELVKYYLLKKALGEQLPSDAVSEGQVYGDDARLPEADDIGNRELHWFVKIKNQNGTKTKRMTKNGSWKVTGNKKEIKDESGYHIGTMRSLVFVEKKSDSGRKKKLLMDEYTLDGSLKKINPEGWVVCKIKQSNRSHERPNSQQEEEEEEEEEEGDGLASTEDNQAMAECPFEPAGEPSYMWSDQSLAMMGTPTLTPTLGGIAYNWENHDDWANMNNGNFFNECLDYIYYPESQI